MLSGDHTSPSGTTSGNSTLQWLRHADSKMYASSSSFLLNSSRLRAALSGTRKLLRLPYPSLNFPHWVGRFGVCGSVRVRFLRLCDRPRVFTLNQALPQSSSPSFTP